MGEGEAAFREAGRHFAAGRFAEAAAAYRRAIAFDARDPAVFFNLAAALRRCGDLPASAAALRAAERLAPGNAKVLGTLVEVLGEWAASLPPGSEPAPKTLGPDSEHIPKPAGGISIVICSIDAAKLAAVRRNFEQALGARPHEFIVIRDARSLAEGYNRGLAACRHGNVVFSHDDVELASPAPFDRLLDALQRADVVGLVGTRLVTGPTVGWAGHPHLHGWIAHPATDKPGLDPLLFSLEHGLVPGMQALDGAFFAARAAVARGLAFDERNFDGFHFYDLDFTYRAHLAGRAVALTTDVIAIHQSRGHYGADWQRGADRFAAKFPRLSGARASNHFYATTVRDRETMLRFYSLLRDVAG